MLAFIFSFLLSFQPQTSVGVTSMNDSTQVPLPDSLDINYVKIDKIFIIGNKVTKNNIILREMDVKPGQVYEEQDLRLILEKDQSKITNTRLFVKVDVTLLMLSDNLADVVVKVSERWYTFPSPIFGLVDRNFNDWLQNQNGDLSRTNFGVKIFRSNFRGRNESLRATLQFGYTKRFSLFYRVPYFDKKQRQGFSVIFDYAENKNIAYQTVGHARLFFDSEELLRIQRQVGFAYRYRKSFYTTHSFRAIFNNIEINDTIPKLNPDYFLNGKNQQKYFELSYSFSVDKRDNNSYPLKGSVIDLNATKSGIGVFGDIDKFDLNLRYSRFLDLGKNYYFANYSSFLISTPQQQPYANFRALGFRKDFIRGYELFVIEGQQYYLNRSTLKKRLFSLRERIGLIPVEQFREFPLDIYVKAYFDMGYVENYRNYEENSLLSNRFLFGSGMGIDFVTYYDTVIRLEYSVNREMEGGFFLHFKKEF